MVSVRRVNVWCFPGLEAPTRVVTAACITSRLVWRLESHLLISTPFLHFVPSGLLFPSFHLPSVPFMQEGATVLQRKQVRYLNVPATLNHVGQIPSSQSLIHSLTLHQTPFQKPSQSKKIKMPEEGVWISPSGKKTFIPLENNPQVFTSLIHDLGVSAKLTFHDVYSLDDPDLLAMVPRPAHALIFITPGPMYYDVRAEDGVGQAKDGLSYDKAGAEEPVTWFLQTIGNACGLIALLHSVASESVRPFVEGGSVLDGLLAEAAPLKPVARADLLYNSEALEKAHMKAARTGDSSAPRADEGVGYHFLAFTRGKDGHLWELEGGCDGPIDRGLLPEGEDMLGQTALDLGVRRFLKHAGGNMEFSIIALSEE